MRILRRRPPASTNRTLETAKTVLDVLRRLQNTRGPATAATLFNLKDTIETFTEDGECDVAIRCGRIVTLLAEKAMLNPEELNDKLWVAAIDAAEEWIWVKE